MNINKSIKSLFKISIVILSYGYIIYKLSRFSVSELLNFSDTLNTENITLLIIVLLLMPVNWGVETIKWKFLIKKLEKISFKKSFKAVLAGVTVSIFTPNRIGEFGGRIFVLKKENRVPAIASTIVGSISQLLTTFVIGVLSLLCFVYLYNKGGDIDLNYHLLIVAMLLFTAICMFLYLRIDYLCRLVGKIKFLNKFNEKIEVLKAYTVGELLKVFYLSIIRYLVFVIQFYLVLRFFGLSINPLEAFVAIASTYFVMAIIPTVSLAEVGIRGSIALYFIGSFIGEAPEIVYASVLLWVINLVVPSIIGSYYFYKFKM